MVTDWYDAQAMPKYERPPVIETAMALEFAPVPGIDVVQLVRLQERWADRYPVVAEAEGTPPTPTDHAPGEMMVHFGEAPRRIWAESPDEALLVQTQADRLILNWRGHDGMTRYPGYQMLRERFVEAWDEMERFMSERGQVLSPHLAEFSYVNRVPIAADEHIADVVNLLSRPNADLPGDERFGRFQFVREQAPGQGHPFPARLTIDGQPQGEAGERALVFTVVAHTLLTGKVAAAIDAVDAAHALASHTFSRIVAEPKQQSWGRIQ